MQSGRSSNAPKQPPKVEVKVDASFEEAKSEIAEVEAIKARKVKFITELEETESSQYAPSEKHSVAKSKASKA